MVLRLFLGIAETGENSPRPLRRGNAALIASVFA